MPVVTPRRHQSRSGAAFKTPGAQPLPFEPVETAPPACRRLPRRLLHVFPREAAAGRQATARWLWPHLLSLDAPLVALVWQACWARAAQVKLPWCHPCVLGLGVWLIYVADRLADSARANPGDLATARHLFHAHWRVGLSFLAAGVAAALVLVTPCVLSHAEFLRGLFLLTLASAYFWLIHGSKRQGWTVRVPKEAVVGGMFAAGTAFFPWCQGGMARLDLSTGVVLFGGLCFCNCALITAWERHAQDVRNRCSLLNTFPWLTARLRGLCLVIACLAASGLLLTGSHLFLPLALAGFLLAVLDHCRDRLSPDALRVLADVALLTPLLFVGF